MYTAAQFAQDAERAIRDIHRRGRLPILVGGTGFYYRSLTRGLFPGPGADEALRARLDKVAARKGPERLHRLLQRVDPDSAARIMPRDRKRLVRALEVYYTTGRALTTHFGETRSLIADCEVVSVALRLPPALTAERVARRVDEQFARGILDRSARAARSRRAGGRAPVRWSRLPAGDGDASWCARRGGDARG